MKTLGEYLRSEREKKGITVEQVASATKISVRILHFIEADDYTDLPAKPFVRGFVISYSRFIGLEPNEVLTRFSDFIEEGSSKRPTKDSGHSGYAFEKKDTEGSRAYLWAFMGIFVVLGGIIIFILKPALRHRRTSHVDQLRASQEQKVEPEKVQEVAAAPVKSEKEKVAQKPKEEPKKEAEPEPVEKESEPKIAEKEEVEEDTTLPQPQNQAVKSAEPNRIPAPTDPLNKGDALGPPDIQHKVVVRALEDIWVRYQVDRMPVMRFVLRKDRLLVLRASTGIRFQVSNPKAAEFRYGDLQYQKFDAASRLARVEHNAILQFPKELTLETANPFANAELLPVTPDP